MLAFKGSFPLTLFQLYGNWKISFRGFGTIVNKRTSYKEDINEISYKYSGLYVAKRGECFHYRGSEKQESPRKVEQII